MKNILKYILLIGFLIVGCQQDNDIIEITEYPYLKEVGYSSKDILSSTNFTTIFIEVLYIDGFKPSNEALNSLGSFIAERTYKYNSIMECRVLDIPLKFTYTIEDIKNIEDVYRSKFTKENQLTVFVLFINGVCSKNEEDAIVLGTAYRNTSFVIFEETIHSLSDSPFEPSRKVLEAAVIHHEFGHLLGLVNIGCAMVTNHEDVENVAHCVSEDCLMYYEIESVDRLVNFIYNEKIPELDFYCLQDLKTNGGR